MDPRVKLVEQKYMKAEGEIPAFRAGDTVRVSVKVKEGTHERLQAFEGVVIARKHGGISESYTR